MNGCMVVWDCRCQHGQNWPFEDSSREKDTATWRFEEKTSNQRELLCKDTKTETPFLQIRPQRRMG